MNPEVSTSHRTTPSTSDLASIASTFIKCRNKYNEFLPFLAKYPSLPTEVDQACKSEVADGASKLGVWGLQSRAADCPESKTSLDYVLRAEDELKSTILGILHMLHDSLEIAVQIALRPPEDYDTLEINSENVEKSCVHENNEETRDSEPIDTISVSSDDSSSTDGDTYLEMESTPSQLALENICEHIRSLFYFSALQRQSENRIPNIKPAPTTTAESIESTLRDSTTASVEDLSDSLSLADLAIIPRLHRDNDLVASSVRHSDAIELTDTTTNVSTQLRAVTASATSDAAPPTGSTPATDTKSSPPVPEYVDLPFALEGLEGRSYVFRIDDLKEIPTKFAPSSDSYLWAPSTEPGSHILREGGISGRYWLNDGYCNREIAGPPQGSVHFKTYSMYYDAGFWISASDASRPDIEAKPWRRVSFEWDKATYASHLAHAGDCSTLRTQRPGQDWPRNLLPNIYHAPSNCWTADTHNQYGGLVGELPILLGLIAFSISISYADYAISTCFSKGSYKTHSQPNGWDPGRGMVIRVFCAPGTSAEDLEALESGAYGNYFD